MNTRTAPPISQITTIEAHQSGAPVGKGSEISAARKIAVRNFMQAHKAKLPPHSLPAYEQAKLTAISRPQLSDEEQAMSMALRGVSPSNPSRKASKARQLYKSLFSQDEDFLQIVLENFQNSLLNKKTDLTDQTDWPDNQKALGKYLLTEMTLEEENTANDLIVAARNSRQALLADHGDYIHGSIAALEEGRKMNLSPLRLKHFVQAYQMLDMPHSDSRTPDIVQLFRALRKSIDADKGIKEMESRCRGLYNVLKREKSQSPNKATSTRQHIILSRIKQLDTLILVTKKHKNFLNHCKKLQVLATPSLSELIHNFLNMTVCSEIIQGANNLVKMAGALDNRLKPSVANFFLTHYSKYVLQSSEMKGMYKNNFQQKQVGEFIIKAMYSANIVREGFLRT